MACVLEKNDSNGTDQIMILPADTQFPINLEGLLELDGAEGDLEDEDIVDFNFGTLATASGIVLISVDGLILRETDTANGNVLKATISSFENFEGADAPPTYTITDLEPKN